MNVHRLRLGEAVQLQRRAVDVRVEQRYREIGVRSFGRGLFLKEPVSGGEIGNKRIFHVHPGDLVVSNVFGWEGAVALADARHAGTVGSHRFMTWTARREDVHLEFVRNYLLSDSGLEQLRQASPGSAGRNRTLSIANFEAIEVPLPDLPEQRRIAAHLDRYERMATLLKPSPPALALPVSVRDTLVRVADGPRVPLRQILKPRSGELVKPDGKYPIAGVYSFGRGLLRRAEISGSETKYVTLTRLERGNVVFSKLGAFENAVAVVGPEYGGTYVSPEFPVFEVGPKANPDYLMAALTTTEFAERLASAATGVGARQRRVSVAAFLALDVPLPESPRQKHVADALRLVSRMQSMIEKRRLLSSAVLPAARNEIFSAMR
ncbi:hypothetical protein GCM10023153_22790 [Ornithinibacter aureus]|uniref:Type I restriction modification DNA specificity domain-containing protein n=1 Tax=Ornithinibacter aureus TaxID=622664 RepID=A0ABP8JYU5_9MICO|nr:restriction endonuclease subunit S [Ornithinibacter aureus]KAF0833965.1 restriction endonuclease S subunit [Ornithinibacter aureus]